MSEADPEAGLRRRLSRQRLLATGLLAAMAAGAVGTTWLRHGLWPDLARAATRAGFIGGVADWFAVTALFRHPLGLPIPHTAIIPREKARLGRALGNFVANHVFTEPEIARLVERADLPGAIGRALADPATRAPIASGMAVWLPQLLTGLSGGSATRILADFAPTLLEGVDFGRMFARGLRGMVEGQRHQAVVSFVLEQLRGALRAKERQLRTLIEDRVREQGGSLLGWALGGSIASRVLAAMNNELGEIDPEGSEIRIAVNEWIEAQIVRFEEEPERAGAFASAVRRVIGHETVGAWSGDVWSRFCAVVERDAASPDGHVAALIDETLERLGRRLREDDAVRARVERMLAASLVRAVPAGRARLADFIATVIANWDERMVVDKLELRVGRDLQFIRINGTLVGFLVGAATFLCLGRG